MIKSTTLALCAIALSGCHTTGHENRAEAYQKIVTGKNGNKFEPRGIKNTSRKDLARLVDATDRAYAVLAFENPKPLIRIVDRTSPALPRGVIAAAAIDEQGKEYLYFERQHLSKALSIEGLVFHEVSHLYVRRVYGAKIPEHGVKFMGVCLQGARRSECEAE